MSRLPRQGTSRRHRSATWLVIVFVSAVTTACSNKTSPPLITEPDPAPTLVATTGVSTTEAPSTVVDGPASTVAATTVIDTPAGLSLTPTTVSPNRPAVTGLDVTNPELAQQIRSQVTEYHLAYFNEYLKLPDADIESLTRFVAPGSAVERAVKTDAKAIKADDIRARRPVTDEVFVLDTGRITELSPTRVRVTSCQANNLIAYYAGPPEKIIEDRMVTVVMVSDYVLLDGKWLEETIRERKTFEGQTCDKIDR